MASPIPALIDAVAIHPICRATGQGPAARFADKFCHSVQAVLQKSGRTNVSIVAGNDQALGTSGHLVLGFTLSDALVDGRPVILVSATRSRVDTPSGDLYPPAARLLKPESAEGDVEDAARKLLVQLGLHPAL